jgi:two-component system chemotaxis family response regulator WspR
VSGLSHPEGEITLPTAYDIMVMLVDDQPMIGEAIRRMISPHPGIDFHYCERPGDALNLARQIRPTVILQDLVMPDMDGMQLVRDYRAQPATRDIPVIVLSTREDPVTKSEAFASGANDYLIKLPDSIELLARLRYHSKSYLNQLQRDEAYRALRESQRQLQEKNIELQWLTTVDSLTGLRSRNYFNEYIALEWRRAIRERNPFSVLMIDIDDFKKYNDTYGHPAGDEVMRRVGESIRSCCKRPTDFAARIGGEEFVVVLPTSNSEAAMIFAELLRSTVLALSIRHGSSSEAGMVSVSIGCATSVPCHGDSPQPLIEAADGALYEAKRSGKNRVVAR